MRIAAIATHAGISRSLGTWICATFGKLNATTRSLCSPNDGNGAPAVAVETSGV